MAKEYKQNVNGHQSIYKPNSRKLDVYFSEPETGAYKNCIIKIITEVEVDENVFKNANHCMGADFIKIFDYSKF